MVSAMSKDDSKSAGLLSKMVRFVRHPTVSWSELDRIEQEQEEDLSKQALKELMERKRRNDFVRKREFAQLRKLQQASQPNISGQALPQGPVEAVDSSLHGADLEASVTAEQSRQPARKSTLQKIDEIELQMSNQWWNGQPPGAAPRNVPVLSEVVAEPAAPAVAAAANGFAPTAVMESAKASAPAPLAPSLAQEGGASVEPEAVAEETAAPFVHDPDFEEAAMLFAHGDAKGAEASLLALTGQRDVPRQLPVWLALLDLYRATGQMSAFEKVGIDFAARYGRSAPQWFAMQGVVQEGAQDAAGKAVPRNTNFRWLAPAQLSLQTLAALQSSKARSIGPWTLDWIHVAGFDEAAAAAFERLLQLWAGEKGTLVMLHVERLLELLESKTPSGDRDADTIWWRLRLTLLRLLNLPDDFELVALDYCVTYEVSPPSWVDPVCMSLREQLAPAAPATVQAPPQPLGRSESGRGTLKGLIEGDALGWLQPVQELTPAGESITIDCTQLVRMDFSAAGSVLNWAAQMQAEGRRLRFVKLHQLVAVFFNVVGIQDHALIVPRQD